MNWRQKPEVESSSKSALLQCSTRNNQRNHMAFSPSDLIKFDKDAYYKKYGNEVMEKSMFQYVNTGYPKVKDFYFRKRAIFESFNASIEESYFWVLNYVTEGNGSYGHVEKIVDLFTASEHSSFWGQQQQRISTQQEKVNQYLATIGKMIKDMFQLVREMRILDERLSYYVDAD